MSQPMSSPGLMLKHKAERELRFKYKLFLKESSLPKEAFDHESIQNIDMVNPLTIERIKIEIEGDFEREKIRNA